MNNKKRIFIVGIMKAGTTALYENLCLHENIIGGSVKELNYYSLNFHLGKEWYENQFPITESNQYTIDASPTYFSQSQSGNHIPNLIKKDFPDAKIIIIARDPVERAVSHFNHLKIVNKNKSLIDIDINDFFDQDFTVAFSPSEAKHWFLGRILESSNYLWPFLMYNGVYDKENLLVLSNKSLKETPRTVMDKVFNFLDLTPIDSPVFKKVRYSLGTKLSQLSEKNVEKLKACLYPSYKKFCSHNKLEFTPVQFQKKKIIPSGLSLSEGWLFLKGGSNRVMEQYKKDSFFETEKLNGWVELSNKRNKLLSEMGITYLQVVVPNKLSIYHNYLNEGISIDYHPLRLLKERIGNQKYFLDLLSSFLKEKNVIQLFWKTDSHWTPYGCFSAYKSICEKLSVNPLNILEQRNFKEAELTLDLGAKCDPPLKEKCRFYTIQKNSNRIFANSIVKYKEANNLINHSGLHVGSHVIFKNKSVVAIDKRVVLFGDSFSEYRTHLLTGMLAETFKEVHFIWQTNLDYEYIQKVKADIVIFQIVERFLSQIPDDNLRINKFAEKKLTTFVRENK